MKNNIYRQKGFTLVEVLVSIALIGITAVAIIGLYIMSLQNNIRSKEVIETTVQSKDVMENIKNTLTNKESKKEEILQQYNNSSTGIVVKIEEDNSFEDIKGKLYIIDVTVEGSQKNFVSKIYVPEK